MTNRKLLVLSGLALAVTTVGAVAQTSEGTVYNEPSRGFFLERGNVNSGKKISLDVASGGTAAGNSLTGEARIGLPGSELIFTGSDGIGIGTLKWGLSQSRSFDWSVYGGFGYLDVEDGGKGKFFRAGLPMTWKLLNERLLLSLVPAVGYYDVEYDTYYGDESEDGTVWSLGGGAYYNIADTNYGKVQAGLEYRYNNGDDDIDICADEADLGLGIRWMYNERVNMDFIFYQDRCDENNTNIPGFARVNIVF